MFSSLADAKGPLDDDEAESLTLSDTSGRPSSAACKEEEASNKAKQKNKNKRIIKKAPKLLRALL